MDVQSDGYKRQLKENQKWAILAYLYSNRDNHTGKLIGMTMNNLKVRFKLSKREIAYIRNEDEQKVT